MQGDGTWTGHAQKLMELGQHYTHTELAPSSQALAKALVELEPLLWERDAIKHWLKPNPGGGKNTLSRCIAQTIQSRTRMQFNWNAFNSKKSGFSGISGYLAPNNPENPDFPENSQYMQKVRKPMKHTYFTTCPYCGAHLDPGERCDCPRASPGGYQYGNRTSTESGQVRKPDGCKKCTHAKCTGADCAPEPARPAGDRV